MNEQTSFSLRDVTDAFEYGVRLGRKRVRPAAYFEFEVEVGPKVKGHSMLKVALTNEQQVKVTLNPKTPKGKPATVDGVPVWSKVTGDVELQAAEDGLSCVIVSSDTPGTSEISVTADADLGEGVEEVADFIEVTVNGAKATSLGLVAETPTDKP